MAHQGKKDWPARLDGVLEIVTRLTAVLAVICTASFTFLTVACYMTWPPLPTRAGNEIIPTDRFSAFLALLDDQWVAFILLMVPLFYVPIKDLILRAESLGLMKFAAKKEDS